MGSSEGSSTRCFRVERFRVEGLGSTGFRVSGTSTPFRMSGFVWESYAADADGSPMKLLCSIPRTLLLPSKRGM